MQPRPGAWYWPDPTLAFSNALSLFNTFFIIIIDGAVNVGFAVIKHPSGEESFARYPHILTSDPEATTIKGAAFGGMILYCIGGMAAVIFILILLPKKRDDLVFRRSTFGLVVRFKASC